jgi:hypothetical protein
MTTAFSFFFSLSYVRFYVQRQAQKQKKTREEYLEKRNKRKRENGQLLLFDGQSIDDKDYAITISKVFLSDACLSLFAHIE